MFLLFACLLILASLNESPSQKEGKSGAPEHGWVGPFASMKALPKRKGNIRELKGDVLRETASMKVPPERKGNILVRAEAATKAGPQ